MNRDVFEAVGDLALCKETQTHSQALRSSNLLKLPNELLDTVTRHLAPLPVVLLGRSCSRVRKYCRSATVATVYSLNALDVRVHRECLDRDSLQDLCAQEDALGPKLAICATCRSVHSPSKFSVIELSKAANLRTCKAASQRYGICKTTTMSFLQLRRHVLAVIGMEGSRAPEFDFDPSRFTAGMAIGGDRLAVARRSLYCLVPTHYSSNRSLTSWVTVDKRGLMLEHRYLVRSKPAGVPLVERLHWAIFYVLRKNTICPHLVSDSAWGPDWYSDDVNMLIRGYQ